MRSSKNSWVLFLCLLAGIVIGGAIGNYLGGISVLEWLRFGYDFGTLEPFTLNLGIIVVRLGFMLTINVASLIGIAISIFVYKRIL
ncbi:MAG: DUF4321 domain-containing protein [Defluviitaleaceae bacterium]|nr:DUF4321 domain-containing protein [Defluviitaleaceae bacterium]